MSLQRQHDPTCDLAKLQTIVYQSSAHTHTTQPFYGSVEFVLDNPGEPVPDETFTHSHSSWSSIIPICFLHLLRSMACSLFQSSAVSTEFRERAFLYCRLAAWNRLPHDIHASTPVNAFKRALKTHLFTEAFSY